MVNSITSDSSKEMTPTDSEINVVPPHNDSEFDDDSWSVIFSTDDTSSENDANSNDLLSNTNSFYENSPFNDNDATPIVGSRVEEFGARSLGETSPTRHNNSISTLKEDTSFMFPSLTFSKSNETKEVEPEESATNSPKNEDFVKNLMYWENLSQRMFQGQSRAQSESDDENGRCRSQFSVSQDVKKVLKLASIGLVLVLSFMAIVNRIYVFGYQQPTPPPKGRFDLMKFFKEEEPPKPVFDLYGSLKNTMWHQEKKPAPLTSLDHLRIEYEKLVVNIVDGGMMEKMKKESEEISNKIKRVSGELNKYSSDLTEKAVQYSEKTRQTLVRTSRLSNELLKTNYLHLKSVVLDRGYPFLSDKSSRIRATAGCFGKQVSESVDKLAHQVLEIRQSPGVIGFVNKSKKTMESTERRIRDQYELVKNYNYSNRCDEVLSLIKVNSIRARKVWVESYGLYSSAMKSQLENLDGKVENAAQRVVLSSRLAVKSISERVKELELPEKADKIGKFSVYQFKKTAIQAHRLTQKARKMVF